MPVPICRILCVDDYEDTSEMLKLLLSQEEYEVVTASSIEEALRFAKSETFDLYVLDRRLPDGTGLELCQKLNQVTPGVRCIFYTGDTYELQRQAPLEAGGISYVSKPDIDALIEVVHKLLAERECTKATSA